MGKKKIFDIAPPKIIFPEKPVIPTEKEVKQKPKRFFRKPPLFFLGAAIIFILVLICLSIEPKVELRIWPVRDQIYFKAQVAVGKGQGSGFIPGETIRAEKSVSQEFPASGKKLKTTKSTGTIRIYNNYSTSPQTLIATTRFLSDDGKLFRTPVKVVIPGAPGSIDIKVVADQPGPEYNIDPSTFSIPGFAGTPKYTSFYGKSFESMAGGYKAEVPEVTQEDLDRAKEILTARVLEESKTAFENSVPSEGYILVEGALVQKVTEVKPLAEKGQELDKFFFQVRAETKALVFKEAELKNFAKEYIRSHLSQQKEFQENSLEIKYSSEVLDLEGNKIILNLEISGKIYSTINENSLKEMVKNKKSDEIIGILKNFPEIEKIEVKLWPFWARSSPKTLEGINIKLNLD